MRYGPDFLLVHLLSLIRCHGGLALDAGSGRGRNGKYLAAQGYRVVALDRFRPGSVAGDVRTLPHPSEIFDLVLCDSVLDTWSGQHELGVAELKRVLKPRGHLFLVVAAAEGSDPAIAFTREMVLRWVADLRLLELLYLRVDHPPMTGVRAQWALIARRP